MTAASPGRPSHELITGTVGHEATRRFLNTSTVQNKFYPDAGPVLRGQPEVARRAPSYTSQANNRKDMTCKQLPPARR